MLGIAYPYRLTKNVESFESFVSYTNSTWHYLVALPQPDQEKSVLLQYDTIDMLWDAFKLNSILPGQGKKGPSPVSQIIVESFD